jgi:guanylate kinase
MHIIILAGPSGVGKGTIKRFLLKEFKNLEELVTTTTRSPRKEDIHGKTYHFVSKEFFKKLIEQNKLIEYDFHFDNYYGSRKEDVEKILSSGNNVLIEVEVKGAMTFKENFPNAKTIFILPPSVDALKERILKRERIGEEELEKRISRFEEEKKYVDLFDYVIVNDDLTTALKEVKEKVLKIISSKN